MLEDSELIPPWQTIPLFQFNDTVHDMRVTQSYQSYEVVEAESKDPYFFPLNQNPLDLQSHTDPRHM